MPISEYSEYVQANGMSRSLGQGRKVSILPASMLKTTGASPPYPALTAPTMDACFYSHPHSPCRLLWGHGKMMNLVYLVMLPHI